MKGNHSSLACCITTLLGLYKQGTVNLCRKKNTQYILVKLDIYLINALSSVPTKFHCCKPKKKKKMFAHILQFRFAKVAGDCIGQGFPCHGCHCQHKDTNCTTRQKFRVNKSRQPLQQAKTGASTSCIQCTNDNLLVRQVWRITTY